MSININEYFNVIKEALLYYGFSEFELSKNFDYNHFIIISKKINIDTMFTQKDIYLDIKKQLELIFEDFENSPFILDLKKKQEKEINILKETIEKIEQQNMLLSEAMTNGMELLDNIGEKNEGSLERN